MIKLLINVLLYVFSSFVAKLIVSFGLGYIVFEGLDIIVETLLNKAISHLSALPATVVQLLSLAGVFEALSVYGSALLTASTVRSMRAIITKFL